MNQEQFPTEKELEILQLIWHNGPSTVRLINEELNQNKKVGYTTTLKLMQIMAEKGLLSRDESSRNHIYHAEVKMNKTQNALTEKFLNQVFGGSSKQLIMQLLGNSKASAKDINEVKEYIKKLESDK